MKSNAENGQNSMDSTSQQPTKAETVKAKKATKVKERDKMSKNLESKEDPNDLGEWEDKVKEAGALPGKANVRHKAHPFGDRTKHRYLSLIFRFDSGKMFEST